MQCTSAASPRCQQDPPVHPRVPWLVVVCAASEERLTVPIRLHVRLGRHHRFSTRGKCALTADQEFTSVVSHPFKFSPTCASAVLDTYGPVHVAIVMLQVHVPSVLRACPWAQGNRASCVARTRSIPKQSASHHVSRGVRGCFASACAGLRFT